MKNDPAVPAPLPAASGFDSRITLIFEGVFDFYGLLDSNGKVVSLAGGIFERTNTDPAMLRGQNFAETVFWQSYEVTSQTLKTAINEALLGVTSRLLLDFRVTADETITVDLTLRPVPPDASGGVLFIGGRAAPPITAADKSEAERLLAAADVAELGLWYWDFERDRIYSTPQCNDLLNIAPHDELTYDAFLTSIHSEDRASVTKFLEDSRASGIKFDEEFRVVYSDGSVEWMTVVGKSLTASDTRAAHMLGAVRKITEEKLAASELSLVYEREKRARDEAVEANRAKDFFLAFVSHELRSPLNAILGWSKILLTKQVDDETRTTALQTIEKSARFQTKLIDDLVDSARVASGKLRLEYRPTNLYEIVNASFQAQAPTASSQGIELTFAADSDQISVFGDAGRLQQIFSNLLSNAIKFTPEGGSVAVEIQTTRDSVAVTVTDTGQGIERESLPNIFRQFSQADFTQSRRNSGLGLGLSIVHILVEKHGGTVRAESPGPGQGSVFTVTLPISMSRQSIEDIQQSAAAPLNPRPLEGIKILIVEDDNDSREVLQLFLEQCGAIVNSTDGARKAMSMLTSSGIVPNVIISDLAMPEEDGYTLISKIRRLSAESGGNIPALALSAFATVESKRRALEAGFTRYATKPFEPDLIVNEILDLVRQGASEIPCGTKG